ncbi:MAG: hypothetical protein O7G85_02945 [Planctomycetota bacterium]|nr:hypothetical protein [Planctomycetota bacterium]
MEALVYPNNPTMNCRRRWSRHRRWFVLILLTVLTGCQSSQGPSRPETVLRRSGDEWIEVNPQRMTRDLQLFASEFSAEVAGTASEIASSTKDRRIREMSLVWRIKTIPIIDMATLIPDPRQGLIAMWLITAEQQGYLSEGRGRNIFGDQQHLAIAAATSLEARIEEVAYRYFTEEQVAEAIQDVQEFTEESPVMSVFNLHDPMAINSGNMDDDGIGGILAAPLAPFRALGGIGDAPTELHRISLVMMAFSRMVEQQPERVRWQMELAMLELESGETLTTVRNSMDRASKGIDSFAKTAEELPTRLREEIDLALDSLDERHEKLAESLTQAEQVSDDLRAASESIVRVTTMADDRLDDIRAFVKQTDETAAAWQGTSQEVNVLIKSIDGMMIGMRENRREDAPPFDINDYTKTATELHKASAEINAILTGIQSADLSGLMQQLDDSSRNTIDYAQASMNVLVDKITWRVILILGVLLGILMAYRVVTTKLATRGG